MILLVLIGENYQPVIGNDNDNDTNGNHYHHWSWLMIGWWMIGENDGISLIVLFLMMVNDNSGEWLVILYDTDDDNNGNLFMIGDGNDSDGNDSDGKDSDGNDSDGNDAGNLFNDAGNDWWW